MSTGEIAGFVFLCVFLYLAFGVFLACEFFDGYGGKHKEDKMAATIFFWPIIFAGAIVVMCVSAVLSAFKGLYYMVRDAIKEDET